MHQYLKSSCAAADEHPQRMLSGRAHTQVLFYWAGSLPTAPRRRNQAMPTPSERIRAALLRSHTTPSVMQPARPDAAEARAVLEASAAANMGQSEPASARRASHPNPAAILADAGATSHGVRRSTVIVSEANLAALLQSDTRD